MLPHPAYCLPLLPHLAPASSVADPTCWSQGPLPREAEPPPVSVPVPVPVVPVGSAASDSETQALISVSPEAHAMLFGACREMPLESS